MLDKNYQRALKEVDEVLKYTDSNLVEKIPNKFINFIHENMDNSHIININPNVNLNKQILLPETENILTLIYLSYWATKEEKEEYYNSQKVMVKSYDEIFKNENVNNTITNKELTMITTVNIITKFINWIKNIITKTT